MISGFTFIKHGLTLGYPIKESIQSIAPLCDEVVINVGYDDPNLEKDDGTYDFLRNAFPDTKYKFIKSWWDPALKKDGMILSQQTNIALAACTGKYCQYIQGDEVIHENDLQLIRDGVAKMENDPSILGLVFDYLHFYGNVDIYKYTRNIYRREVRLIRNHLGIKSWLDAQGFRSKDDQKISCIKIPARIFHYGWARKEQVMASKVVAMDKLYHGDTYQGAAFQYQKIWGLKKFTKSHPAIMTEWTSAHRNDVDLMSLRPTFRFEDLGLMISDAIESITDYRIGEYKNYRLL